MARKPLPTILRRINKATGREMHVREAPGVWAVLYDGVHVQVVHTGGGLDEKYYRTTYSLPGFAQRAAADLNKKYNTTKFEAVQVMETE